MLEIELSLNLIISQYINKCAMSFEVDFAKLIALFCKGLKLVANCRLVV
jgi:hypothetical protein